MTPAHYPDRLPIEPWSGPPPRAAVRVPGSKSLTNRALVVAALADGPSRLIGCARLRGHAGDGRGAADAGDRRRRTTSSTRRRSAFKAAAGSDPLARGLALRRQFGNEPPFPDGDAGDGGGTFHLDGSPRMRQRPISDLLDALATRASERQSDLGTGCPPVTIEASGLSGGLAVVKGDVSSQFLSGLLMALPYARERDHHRGPRASLSRSPTWR